MVVRLCASPYFSAFLGVRNPRRACLFRFPGVSFMGVCLVAVVAAG